MVFYTKATKPLKGLLTLLSWFRKNNIPYLFLTNTTSKSRAELVEKLTDLNIKTKKEDFLTPPVAARQWFHTNMIYDIALFVPETTKEEFSDFNFITNENDKVDAIVIGDLGEQWTFNIMNTCFQIIDQ